MKKLKSLLCATLFLSGTTLVHAQDISTRLDLPEWTKDLSVSAAFVSDSMDFDGGPQSVTADGVVVEIANDFSLGESLWTQSVLRGKATNSREDFFGFDNQSIGVAQRLLVRFDVSGMALIPSIGAGVNVGGIEYEATPEAGDQGYFSYGGEARLTLDTMDGYAPYLSYGYEVGNLESSQNDLTIQSLSAGVSLIF